MAYNLPDAWDPGYVLPKNVRDEGLERRAFVTKQMPRGTYDQPDVGTGGYRVPKYVMDEGYGQGTFTTKWQRSGSYSGPKVPNWLNQRPKVVREQPLPGGGRVVTIQAMGDAPLPAPFEDYGAKAAQMLIAQVSALPPGQRVTALRQILDKVDRSLWGRTQDIMRRYQGQGMAPPQAFSLALARALSTGIAAEIIDTGLRRSAPQARSLLGLGCYGPRPILGAMGDAPLFALSPPPTSANTTIGGGNWFQLPTTPVPPPTSATAVTSGFTLPVPPPPPPGPTIMAAGIPFDSNKVTRIWGSGDGGVGVNDTPDLIIDDPAKIPDETAKYLHDALTTIGEDIPHVGWGGNRAGMEWNQWDAGPWFDRLGILSSTPMAFHTMWRLRTGVGPMAALTNPVNGDHLFLHMILTDRDRTKPADPATNPLVMKVFLSKVPDPSLWGQIVRGMFWLPAQLAPVSAAVGEAVVAGIKGLGDLACGLVNTPGLAAAAGAAGGAVAGIPPQAGAAAGSTGAQLAKGACGNAPPPLAVPVAQPSILPLALLAGGGVLLAFLFLGPHKPKPSKSGSHP